MSFLHFYDSSDPPSSSKFFLSKINVSLLLPWFFLEFQIFPFQNECLSFTILRFSFEFQIRSFQKRVSLLRFHDSLDPSSSSKFVLFKNECLSFVSTILRILLRVSNSSFSKLMSLFYLLEFQILPFQKKSFFFKDWTNEIIESNVKERIFVCLNIIFFISNIYIPFLIKIITILNFSKSWNLTSPFPFHPKNQKKICPTKSSVASDKHGRRGN